MGNFDIWRSCSIDFNGVHYSSPNFCSVRKFQSEPELGSILPIPSCNLVLATCLYRVLPGACKYLRDTAFGCSVLWAAELFPWIWQWLLCLLHLMCIVLGLPCMIYSLFSVPWCTIEKTGFLLTCKIHFLEYIMGQRPPPPFLGSSLDTKLKLFLFGRGYKGGRTCCLFLPVSIYL